jgi:hypothetical protein
MQLDGLAPKLALEYGPVGISLRYAPACFDRSLTIAPKWAIAPVSSPENFCKKKVQT